MVVIREHHERTPAKQLQFGRDVLRTLDFHIHGARSRGHRRFQNVDLLLDASVEPSFILVSPARRQNGALRMQAQEPPDRLDALRRVFQIVQPELEERFAGLDLAPGVLQKFLHIGETHRDANSRERRTLRHECR